ncbi:MAG: type II secretion system protein, partial [Candidatus Kerfeldbacteria bacterium]|nr:type II secretion system protein [Candidatus Kerfeldbacteria bacterium]
MTTQKKGFTLIELLVVIAIIGILSAIGLVSLNGAREKARDAQRQSDIATMRTALQLYTDDHTNQYPTVAATGVIEDVGGNFETAMVTEYLPTTPAATGAAGACGNANNYWYAANGTSGTSNDATTFALGAQL